mgnify:CR=1 FL=1
MSYIFYGMPVDRTTIRSRLRIHPDLLADPNGFFRRRRLEARSFKTTRGRCERGPTRNITLKLLNYRGIEAKVRKVSGDPLTDATIRFNPGVCLYGHNGSSLSIVEFLDALSILATHLKPILFDPGDWIDLIPGLRSGGVAYWDYVEVNLHSADPDGIVLERFRHGRHPALRAAARNWPESIEFGGHRGKFRIGIYRKAVEMIAHGKLPPKHLAEYQHVLRFEVRLKAEKLADYMGNERNLEVIEGVPRLVRFLPQDAVAALRGCLSAFEGVYESAERPLKVKSRDQLAPLGTLLARVALDPRSSLTFPELLEHIRFYEGGSCVTKEARKKLSDTIRKIRDAGMAELSSRSSLSSDELFSDAAIRDQLGVARVELEKKVSHDLEDTFGHPLIYKSYRPAGQPFQPMAQWPGYLKM